MLYVDTSALLKLYVDEHGTAVVVDHLANDVVLVTSQLTEAEVRRNLARLLDGDALLSAQQAFAVDLDAFAIVALDRTVLSNAAQIAESTLGRSLDAVHLAAARRAGPNISVLTFDVRQAKAARQIGLATIGA